MFYNRFTLGTFFFAKKAHYSQNQNFISFTKCNFQFFAAFNFWNFIFANQSRH